jgi:hypothetical protein
MTVKSAVLNTSNLRTIVNIDSFSYHNLHSLTSGIFCADWETELFRRFLFLQ